MRYPFRRGNNLTERGGEGCVLYRDSDDDSCAENDDDFFPFSIYILFYLPIILRRRRLVLSCTS